MTHEPSPFAIGIPAGYDELQAMREKRATRLDFGASMETGIGTLDWMLGGADGGLKAGELVVIGAQSGHGKSALAETIALEVSRRKKTVYLALELGKERTTDRIVAKLIGTDEQSAHNAIAQATDMGERAVRELLETRNLIIEERSLQEAYTLDHVAAQLCNDAPRVLFIDHLRHLDDWLGVPARGQRADLATMETARRLRVMARDYKCCIVAVHQLKNELIHKRPTQHDLADTSALAQVADHVWLIRRPFRGDGVYDDTVELIVDKNRRGPEGVIHLEWTGRLMRYRDFMPDQEARCCKKTPENSPRR